MNRVGPLPHGILRDDRLRIEKALDAGALAGVEEDVVLPAEVVAGNQGTEAPQLEAVLHLGADREARGVGQAIARVVVGHGDDDLPQVGGDGSRARVHEVEELALEPSEAPADHELLPEFGNPPQERLHAEIGLRAPHPGIVGVDDLELRGRTYLVLRDVDLVVLVLVVEERPTQFEAIVEPAAPQAHLEGIDGFGVRGSGGGGFDLGAVASFHAQDEGVDVPGLPAPCVLPVDAGLVVEEIRQAQPTAGRRPGSRDLIGQRRGIPRAVLPDLLRGDLEVLPLPVEADPAFQHEVVQKVPL